MDTLTLLNVLSQAASESQSERMAECFNDNIVYHDTIYGTIKGKPDLVAFFDRWWEEGSNYIWKFTDIVTDERRAAGRFTFSYMVKSKALAFPHITVPGMFFMKLKEGKISLYDELTDTGLGMLAMGLSDRMLIRKLKGIKKLRK